jgi:Spy/CpxP family protein refolding chaperone
MNRKRVIVIVLGCLLLVVTPGLLLAFEQHGGTDIQPVDALRLLFNEDQNKQLDALLSKYEPDMEPQYRQLRKYRHELEAMFNSGTATDQNIKAQISQISDAEYQLAVKHAALTVAIRKIATPEQLAKVDAMEAAQARSREEYFDSLSQKRQGARSN